MRGVERGGSWGGTESGNFIFDSDDSMSDISPENGSRSVLSSIESLIQKMTVMRTKSEGDYPSSAEPPTPLSTSDINLDVLKRKVDIRIVPSIKSLSGSAPDLLGVSLPPENLEDLHEEAHEHEHEEQEPEREESACEEPEREEPEREETEKQEAEHQNQDEQEHRDPVIQVQGQQRQEEQEQEEEHRKREPEPQTKEELEKEEPDEQDQENQKPGEQEPEKQGKHEQGDEALEQDKEKGKS